MGSGGIVPLILNFGTSWSTVNFNNMQSWKGTREKAQKVNRTNSDITNDEVSH
jgi:hypothetical protein